MVKNYHCCRTFETELKKIKTNQYLFLKTINFIGWFNLANLFDNKY